MYVLEALRLCLKPDHHLGKAALMPLRFYARAALVLALAAPLSGALTPSYASSLPSLPADSTSDSVQLRAMMALRQSLLDTLEPEDVGRGQMLALNAFATAEAVLSLDIRAVRAALGAEEARQRLIAAQTAQQILASHQTAVEAPGALGAPGVRPLIANETTNTNVGAARGAVPKSAAKRAWVSDAQQAAPVPPLTSLGAIASWATKLLPHPVARIALAPTIPAAPPLTGDAVETGTITFTSPSAALAAPASGRVLLPNGAELAPLSIAPPTVPTVLARPAVHAASTAPRGARRAGLHPHVAAAPQAQARVQADAQAQAQAATQTLQAVLSHRLHVLTVALARVHALRAWAETTALPATLPATNTVASPDDLAARFDNWAALLPVATLATTATAPLTATDASAPVSGTVTVEPVSGTVADTLPPAALGGVVALTSGVPLSGTALALDSVPPTTTAPLSDGVPLSTTAPLSDGVPFSDTASLVVRGAVAPVAASPTTGTVTGVVDDAASTMPIDGAVPFGGTPVTTTSVLASSPLGAASSVTTTTGLTPTGTAPDATSPATPTVGVSMTVAGATAHVTTTMTLADGAPFTLTVALPAAVADLYAPAGFGSKRGALESVLRQGQTLFARLKAGQGAADAAYQTQLRSVASQNSIIESHWNGLIYAYDNYQNGLAAFNKRKTAFDAYAHDLHVSRIQHALWVQRSADWTRYAQLLHAYTIAVNAAASNPISTTVIPPRPLQPVYPGPEPLAFTEVMPAWPGSPPAYVAYPGPRPAGYALPTPPPAVPPWDGVTISTDVLAEARLIGTSAINAALYANGHEETTQSALLAAGALDGVGGYEDPLHGVISTYWGGSTIYQSFHPGLDIEGSLYTPIHATAAGVVVYASYATPGARHDSYGLCVIIEHNAHVSSLYAHMDDQVNGLHVRVGDIVQQGQVIGNIGMTGWTTGPHLHFELRQDNVQFDPLLLIPNPQD